MTQPAVFLDRDGTLIEEAGYLDRIERIQFFPFSIDAVRLLNHGGFAVVVVTNQAGVARGIFPESFVAVAHGHLRERLAAGGAAIDGFYYCPHHPDGTIEAYRRSCDCRKPGPRMLVRVMAFYGVRPRDTIFVGDSDSDRRAAAAAAVRFLDARELFGWDQQT